MPGVAARSIAGWATTCYLLRRSPPRRRPDRGPAEAPRRRNLPSACPAAVVDGCCAGLRWPWARAALALLVLTNIYWAGRVSKLERRAERDCGARAGARHHAAGVGRADSATRAGRGRRRLRPAGQQGGPAVRLCTAAARSRQDLPGVARQRRPARERGHVRRQCKTATACSSIDVGQAGERVPAIGDHGGAGGRQPCPDLAPGDGRHRSSRPC